MLSGPNKDFLDKTIQIAQASFIDGHVNNKNFRNVVTAHEEIANRTQQGRVYASTSYHIPQFNDLCFSDYNANVIPESNLIAAAGPKSLTDVAAFFYHLAFNANLSTPIQEIVAFGYCLNGGKYHGDYFDFFDYLTASGVKQVSYVLKTAENDKPAYTIEATYLEVTGKLEAMQSGQLYSPDDKSIQAKVKLKCIYPAELALSDTQKLESKEIELHISFHSLVDNASLDLSKHEDKTKEMFWQHYQKSLHAPVLIHCASGVGRTGHFILILELLRHFERIFTNTTQEQAAEEILTVVNQIRKTRPGLIWNKDQFVMAIHNTVVLRHYALAKGYPLDGYRQILQATPTPEWSSFLAPVVVPLEAIVKVVQAKAVINNIIQNSNATNFSSNHSLTQIKAELIAELKSYKVNREKGAETYGLRLFSFLKYKKQDKVKAAQFLIDLLENNITLGAVSQHQGALRNGQLGESIRNFAKKYDDLGTVRNLLKVAYEDYNKSNRKVDHYRQRR